ncbi:MAG: SRPBCC family protein [Bryobacteraceae bacterium]
MARLETSIEIAAPPAEVFAFFVPQRMAYWYGADMASELEVQGGAPDFRVAQKVRVTGKLGKKEVGHTAVVTQYDWPCALEWKFQDSYGVRGTERWELQPAGKDARRTVLHMRSEYELPGRLGRLVDWLLTRHAVARRNREYLARLQKLAERR